MTINANVRDKAEQQKAAKRYYLTRFILFYGLTPAFFN